MKKYKIIVLLLVSLLFVNCAVSKWHETQVATGGIENAIGNSITDFIYTSKLVKTDSIFKVSVIDTNPDILIVGIARPSDIIRPSYKNKVGTYDDIFPTRYLTKDGKLFYWSDSTQVITQEIIDTLKRYDYIDFSWTELPYEMIHGVNDDGVEGMVYYICKNNYKNYKKTGISNFNKRYKTPILKCNDN